MDLSLSYQKCDGDLLHKIDLKASASGTSEARSCEKIEGGIDKVIPVISEVEHTSFFGVVVHLVMLATSPTLMNVPSTFADVGYLIGFVGSLLIVLFYANSMHRLVSVEQSLRKNFPNEPHFSYSKTIYYSFVHGPRLFRRFSSSIKLLVDFNFICVWAGGNSIYVLLACDNFRSIYKYIYDCELDIRWAIIYLSVPLIVLSWIPNLKLMVACSVTANVLNFICIIVVFVFSLIGDRNSTHKRVAIGDIRAVPLFLGTILITINATGLMMPLKKELKKPERFFSTFGVLNISYMPVCILYSTFGLLCYLKYGNDINENVLLNIPINGFGTLILALYTLAIITMYPLVSYITYDVIWNNNLREQLKESSLYVYLIGKYVFKTLNAMSSIGLAFLVPNIGVFVSLTGSVGTSLDSIILPAVAEILVVCGRFRKEQCASNSNRTFVVIRNFVIIAFGVVLCLAGLFDSIKTL